MEDHIRGTGVLLALLLLLLGVPAYAGRAAGAGGQNGGRREPPGAGRAAGRPRMPMAKGKAG